jgi:hypothetical protein
MDGIIQWDDAPNDRAKIEVWHCPGHMHMTIAVLGTKLGYHIVLPREEAVALCSKILAGLEDEEAGDAAGYDTSALWIA